MNCGLINLPIVPGRSEPSDKAEMVTQLLFGECYDVLEVQKKWVLVENVADHYQCWIDRKQHSPIAESEYKEILNTPQKQCGDPMGMVTNKSGKRFNIPCSSILPFYKEGNFKIGENTYQYDGRIARHDPESRIRHALRLVHAPYLWGGKSAMGIDCSGFTQVVFSCAGIQIPRDAYQQAEIGESVDFTTLSEPGDLAFFDNEEGRITHVGIVLENGKIVHSSGSVRIDSFDHHGIYNDLLKEYSHKLRLIKRISL